MRRDHIASRPRSGRWSRVRSRRDRPAGTHSIRDTKALVVDDDPGHGGWQPGPGGALPAGVRFRRFSWEAAGTGARSSVGCVPQEAAVAMVENGQSAGRGKPSTAYTGQAAGWNELAEKLSALARAMQDEKGLEHTLDAIVLSAADTVPGADEASISVVSRRRVVHTPAATGALPRAVDQAQYQTGQGPCLDSLYEHRTLRLPDICA